MSTGNPPPNMIGERTAPKTEPLDVLQSVIAPGRRTDSIDVLLGYDDAGGALFAHVTFDAVLRKGMLTKLASLLKAMEEIVTP